MYKAFNFILTAIIVIALSSHDLIGQQTAKWSPSALKADSLIQEENYTEAIKILESILNRQEHHPDALEWAGLEYKLGYSLMSAGRDIEAMKWFRRVISTLDPQGNTGLICDAMSGLGRSFEYTGMHDSAFFWYMEAFKLVQESTDILRKARELRNMAQLLRVLRRYNEAETYCRIALELIPDITDFRVVANIYNEIAYLHELSGNLDSAAYYYNRLIDISVENGYLKGESVGYSNLASVYETEKRYDEAVTLKHKGLEIDRRIGDNYGLMNSWRGLGNTYLLMGNYREALNVLEMADALCDSSWIVDKSGIELYFYRVFKATGKFREALMHYEAYNNLRERINEEASKKQVAELLARYESEKKEQQIQLLEQSNLLNENKIRSQRLLIGVLVLLGMLLSMASWYWIRNRNQALKRMHTELHHFLLSQEKDKIEEQAEVRENESTSPTEVYLKWGLTPRESEILFYLGKGCTNADIAVRLFVSENTIKFHIKNIYLKLDVKNRIQALLRCNGNDLPA